MLFRKSKFL
uniref:Uncharacterized protein n=1 Tax=Romanomermis culicivorax TaxID=13658 RepID=A0A915K3M8_ROMCU